MCSRAGWLARRPFCGCALPAAACGTIWGMPTVSRFFGIVIAMDFR
jgi:hypothetical protein